MNNNLIGFLGASFVGKSHIVHSLSNKYNIPYKAYVTIGCQITKYENENKNYSLCDIYPQYSYIKTAHKWIKNFSLHIFICDATNLSSINTIKDFYLEIKPINYAIFINKSDLVDDEKKGEYLQRVRSKFKNYISISFTDARNREDLTNKFNKILNAIY